MYERTKNILVGTVKECMTSEFVRFEIFICSSVSVARINLPFFINIVFISYCRNRGVIKIIFVLNGALFKGYF